METVDPGDCSEMMGFCLDKESDVLTSGVMNEEPMRLTASKYAVNYFTAILASFGVAVVVRKKR